MADNELTRSVAVATAECYVGAMQLILAPRVPNDAPLPDAAQPIPPRSLLGIHEALCDARRWIDANATIDLVLQDLFERIARLQRAA